MIIKLKKTDDTTRDHFFKLLKSLNLSFRHETRYGIEAILLLRKPEMSTMDELFKSDAIYEIVEFEKDYKLASREFKSQSTVIDVDGVPIGGNAINIMAGPCSVENEQQIFEIASFLASKGVNFIRGGAYKPRSSPYRFQGLGKDGLKLIRRAADQYGLRVVTEVMDTSLIEEVSHYSDILQVGSRNMHNFYFLKQLGKINKPILLKRGMYAKVEEWLMAAEYILSGGNEKVIMCERGFRTFDPSFRNTLDLAAVALVKQLSHLPVIADPSHGTGRRHLIAPMSQAAVAAGADGLIVEIHPDPKKALSDSLQTLNFLQFEGLLEKVKPIAEAMGRTLDLNRFSNVNIQRSISI